MKPLITIILTILLIFLCGCSFNDSPNAIEQEEYTLTQNEITDQSDIPKISTASKLLNKDWETLLIRAGNSIDGPSEQWKNLSISHYHLKNIDTVSCYWDTSSKTDVIGVESGKIVFWGTYGHEYAQVKDFLSDASLKVEPYVCLSENGELAYIWEMQNGYLMIITMASDNTREWYNQYVHCVVHSKKLNYLGPLQLVSNNNTQDNVIDGNNNITDNNTQNDSGTGQKTITGQVVPSDTDFPSWKIVCDSPVDVYDWDGAHTCNTLYFYEDTTLNGLPISEYAGITLTLTGTPENYRGAGRYFIYDPILLKTKNEDIGEIPADADFTEIFPLHKRGNWYNNGIFEAYFSEIQAKHPGVTYEYIGSNFENFSIISCDTYTFFDVYYVEYPNSKKEYYLLPGSGYMSPPEVYQYIGQTNLIKVWYGIA